MLCDRLPQLIGLGCTVMDAEGTLALIESPFRFTDGDSVTVFAEQVGDQVRFFDSGGTAWHLDGRGVSMRDARRTRFLREIAERFDVNCSDDLELEVWATAGTAAQAYARLVSALLAVVEWERASDGTDLETAALLDEVATLLARTAPDEELARDVMLTGISKQQHRMDFRLGRQIVVAVRPHHLSVSSAIRRLLDVKNLPSNAQYEWRVILDDRTDPEGADKEGAVLGTVARVTMFRALQNLADTTGRLQ